MTLIIGVLDAGMVAAATLCLNIFHPAFLRTIEEPAPETHVSRLVDRLRAPRTQTDSTGSLPPYDEIDIYDAKYNKKSDQDSEVGESEIATVC